MIQHASDITLALSHMPHVGHLPAEIKNPIEGIVPDFSVFGAKFDSMWKKLFAGVWAAFLIMSIVYLARGILGIAQNSDSNPMATRHAKREAIQGAIAVGGLAALAVIVGAILAIVG